MLNGRYKMRELLNVSGEPMQKVKGLPGKTMELLICSSRQRTCGIIKALKPDYLYGMLSGRF
jgi:hypothetical protein